MDRVKLDALLKQERYQYHFGALIRIKVGPEAEVPDFEMIIMEEPNA